MTDPTTLIAHAQGRAAVMAAEIATRDLSDIWAQIDADLDRAEDHRAGRCDSTCVWCER